MTDNKQAMKHPLAYTYEQIQEMTIREMAATAAKIRELLKHAKTTGDLTVRDVCDLGITVWHIDNALYICWLKDDPERKVNSIINETTAKGPQAPGAPGASGNEH